MNILYSKIAKSANSIPRDFRVALNNETFHIPILRAASKGARSVLAILTVGACKKGHP
jgi:hypothetical protein